MGDAVQGRRGGAGGQQLHARQRGQAAHEGQGARRGERAVEALQPEQPRRPGRGRQGVLGRDGPRIAGRLGDGDGELDEVRRPLEHHPAGARSRRAQARAQRGARHLRRAPARRRDQVHRSPGAQIGHHGLDQPVAADEVSVGRRQRRIRRAGQRAAAGRDGGRSVGGA
ncbi:MAG: hypothetical protein H6704_26500 [Myxococcales bacterium]|nr:hypothetical protein [Myxococcales bacterium]